MFAASNSPNTLNRVLMIVGAVLLAWGIQKLVETGNPTEAEIQAGVETMYQQELYRMEQAQINKLGKMKDEIGTMSDEEKAIILMQASRPIELSPEREAMHKQAIRRDITEAHAYKKKKASALTFAGGALLFLMLSPMFSTWVSNKILRKLGDKE